MTSRFLDRRLRQLELEKGRASDHVDAFARDVAKWRRAGVNAAVVAAYDGRDGATVIVMPGHGERPYSYAVLTKDDLDL